MALEPGRLEQLLAGGVEVEPLDERRVLALVDSEKVEVLVRCRREVPTSAFDLGEGGCVAALVVCIGST